MSRRALEASLAEERRQGHQARGHRLEQPADRLERVGVKAIVDSESKDLMRASGRRIALGIELNVDLMPGCCCAFARDWRP
jgi:hypothetical protein